MQALQEQRQLPYRTEQLQRNGEPVELNLTGSYCDTGLRFHHWLWNGHSFTGISNLRQLQCNSDRCERLASAHRYHFRVRWNIQYDRQPNLTVNCSRIVKQLHSNTDQY